MCTEDRIFFFLAAVFKKNIFFSRQILFKDKDGDFFLAARYFWWDILLLRQLSLFSFCLLVMWLVHISRLGEVWRKAREAVGLFSLPVGLNGQPESLSTSFYPSRAFLKLCLSGYSLQEHTLVGNVYYWLWFSIELSNCLAGTCEFRFFHKLTFAKYSSCTLTA